MSIERRPSLGPPSCRRSAHRLIRNDALNVNVSTGGTSAGRLLAARLRPWRLCEGSPLLRIRCLIGKRDLSRASCGMRSPPRQR